MSGSKGIKVLAVGNSFSEDASTYVNRIAAAGGVDLTIVNLYIGGCSLETHWNNAVNDAQVYDYQPDGIRSGRMASIREALEEGGWNYVTMQQVSDRSGQPQTYYPFIENLARYLKGIKPDIELLIHQTWAYETGYDRLFIYGGQREMFESLKKAYFEAAERVGRLTLDGGAEISPSGKPLRIIPCGQAMQNARALPLFDDKKEDTIKLCRDGFHASLIHGRYLLGAVWYEVLTGRSVLDNDYRPEDMTAESWDMLKQCAHDAAREYNGGR